MQAESFWNPRKEACKVIGNVANIAGTPTSTVALEEDSDTVVESDLEEDGCAEDTDSANI